MPRTACRERLNTPGGMLAVLAGPIKADCIAGWVDENRLAPQLGLVNGFVLEYEAL